MIERTKRFLRSHWLFIALLVALVAWAIYSYASHGVIFSLFNSDYQKLINFVDSFGFWAWLILVLLVILEVVFAPVPSLILYVIAGLLFGTLLGGLLILIGNIIGAFIDFKIARVLGRNFVERRVKKEVKEKFDNFSKKYGGVSLFLLRLNPFTSSDLFSYLAGLTKMKTSKFLLATTLGLIPLIFVKTYVGEVLTTSNQILSSIIIVASVLYLIIFVYLFLKSLKKKPGP